MGNTCYHLMGDRWRSRWLDLEPLVSQEISGVRVLDGERMAVAAIAQLELALEVDRPDDIRAGDRGPRLARMNAALRAAR